MEAIEAVAFRGADASTVSHNAVDQGIALEITRRNIDAVSSFGEAIPADLRK